MVLLAYLIAFAVMYSFCKEKNTMSDNQSTAAAETASAPESVLGLNDIQNAVKVIDFAAEQGAFRGWETIEKVLEVRTRLNNFLSAAAAQQDTPPAATSEDNVPEVTFADNAPVDSNQ